MSVTINAHQLSRLIDKTISHMASEYVEPLHGIRLDVDAKYVYAVASDRYTIAVARYQLNHGDQQQEPWARTIPAEYLRSLREWIQSMEGAGLITISTAKDRLIFEGPQSDLSIAVTPGLEFPDWRGLLRKMVEQTVEGELFPCLNSGYLSRFNTGDILRVRFTADEKPAVVFAEDFIGALMPARHAGVYPCKEETFEGAHKSWLWTLAAGSTDASLDGAAYEEDRPLYDVTTDIRETGEALLQQTLRSGWDMSGKSTEKRDEFLAHCLAAVNGWTAFRYLDALYNVDPRAAAAVVAEVAGELESGEIGDFAWDAAEAAGFDPEKWHSEYDARLKAVEKKPAA
ncbi:hypothetical protein [Streptomyces sp. KN37]|uniref:hypothetical protein n=1 Tax=Streptomyces sp. KN37 TaxID=3090667 RepID=UPI002A762CB7|nr:hypothetical protein [Streptomyces sp. KN37]WPO70251.1 hypothetical protein R9806_06210 [Streptomyces sp. KN37]WPO73980.1 hypothetical protein R9806_26860 [Streptomyces sp. KN37]